MRFSFAGAVLLAACQSNSVVVGDLEEVTSFSAVTNRNLDILFVIDNSGSMAEQQASLAANFDLMIDVLEQLDGGLPDLHIGVVTSDMGTSSSTQPPGPGVGTVGQGGCANTGDNGALQTASMVTGNFISDIAQSDGTRARNYTGALRDAFGELARVGAQGCGFEQHLRAMRGALVHPGNAGFLRPEANLAVVVIADEDDCSLITPALLSPGDSGPLGPLSSFRCARFGIKCDQQMDQIGTKTNCEPDPASQYVEDVQPFVNDLLAVKDDPRKIMVAAIVGDPTPVQVDFLQINGQSQLSLVPSCTFSGVAGPETAEPAVRLAAFLDAFPARSKLTSICNADLSGALSQIGASAKKLIGDPCLDTPKLVDSSLEVPGIQPACEVLDIRDSSPNSPTILPTCGPGSTDCFEILSDTAACPSAPDNLRVKLRRSAAPELDTWSHVRCQLTN
jgi:hypothetical protein